MNLILLGPADVDADGHATLRDGRAAHVRTVLRAVAGDTIRIGLVDGPAGTGTITSIDAGAVRLLCKFEAAPMARPRIDLLLALPRPKVMNRLWAQLAAIGVGRIILTNAARVERPYFDTHVLDPAHYRPLLIDGLQQARDTWVPQVSIHRQFRILVEDDLDTIEGDTIRLVADPAASTPLADVVRDDGSERRLLVAIGPEGGWNAFELELLTAHGFTPIGMGARTLRSDTACIALLALAHAARARRL